MINNGHESMYKHGGRYLDCRFSLPWFLCFVFFLFPFFSCIIYGVMGLHMDIPCLVGRLPLSVYDYIPHFLDCLHIKKVVDRRILDKQRLIISEDKKLTETEAHIPKSE